MKKLITGAAVTAIALGAGLAAGPVKGGGFAVRIRLPLEVGEPVTAAATETDTGRTQGGKKDAHPDR